MTARVFSDGGLSSLTALNARLIAMDVQGAETDDSTDENDILDVGAERPPDPDADPTDSEPTPEVRGRFSVEDPLEFNRVKEWIEANIFGGQTTGFTPLINSFVNEWDVEWRRDKGLSPTEAITRGPTLEDLTEDQRFLNGAIWLPLTATGQVPPLFETTNVDDEGNETGPAIGVADPLTGVEFIEVTPDLAALKERPSTLFEVVKRTGLDLIRRARGVSEEEFKAQATPEQTPEVNTQTGFVTGTTAELNLPGWAKTAILHSDPAAEGREPREPLPQISQPELVDRLVATQKSGGGGGSGGTRREIQFDRDHLMRQVADLYNDWMFDPGEAPESVVGGVVDRYVREARALWSGKGVQKNFDTFVRDELRKLPRYQTIYEHKLPSQTEEDFKAQFANPIGQLGLRPETARRQTVAALTSGGSPQGQLQRVAGTREAQLRPGFSQRLAQTLRGVGVG